MQLGVVRRLFHSCALDQIARWIMLSRLERKLAINLSIASTSSMSARAARLVPLWAQWLLTLHPSPMLQWSRNIVQSA